LIIQIGDRQKRPASRPRRQTALAKQSVGRTILSVIEKSTDRIVRPTTKWQYFGTPGDSPHSKDSLAEALRFGNIPIVCCAATKQQRNENSNR
jgi:hypothetical protein